MMIKKINEANFIEVKVSQIVIEGRFRKDYGDIKGFAAKIKEFGLLHPPVVVPISGSNMFRLVAGGRRMKAISLLKWETVTVNVITGVDDLDAIELEYIENYHRMDLGKWEDVKLVKAVDAHRRKKCPGWTMEDTAELLGITKSAVSQDIKVSQVIERIPQIADLAENKSEVLKLVKSMSKDYQAERKASAFKEEIKNTPIDVAKEKLVNAFVIGDVMKKLKEPPDNFVDFIHCDPPFGNAFPTNQAASDIKKTADELKYYEISRTKFVAYMNAVIPESYRILKDDGWILIWHSAQHQVISLVYQMLKLYKFEVGEYGLPLMWYNQRGNTNVPKRYLGSAYLMGTYARKGKAELKKARTNVFHYPGLMGGQKVHKAEMPINMLVDLFSCFVLPGDQILDWFLGSGNSILAACNYKCNCFGYDLSPDNKNYFTVKVKDGTYGEYSTHGK